MGSNTLIKKKMHFRLKTADSHERASPPGLSLTCGSAFLTLNVFFFNQGVRTNQDKHFEPLSTKIVFQIKKWQAKAIFSNIISAENLRKPFFSRFHFFFSTHSKTFEIYFSMLVLPLYN